jgi:hypothetical protein
MAVWRKAAWRARPGPVGHCRRLTQLRWEPPRLSESPDHSRRYSGDECRRWNVAGDNCTGGYDGIGSDGHSGYDARGSAGFRVHVR